MPKNTRHEPDAAHPQRRSRGEIDRNFLWGDILIKTGAACGVALMLVAAYTPFTLMSAIEDGMWDYLGVVGAFGAIGVACYLVGRHLRHEATHWDFD